MLHLLNHLLFSDVHTLVYKSDLIHEYLDELEDLVLRQLFLFVVETEGELLQFIERNLFRKIGINQPVK